MPYIKQEDILQATRGGLDIIFRCYPQARIAQQKGNKQFKIRDERTPSAGLKQMKDGNWIVTDFGGDQISRNGIQVFTKEENMTFPEALVKLAEIYGIGGIKAEIHKSNFTRRKALPEEKSGSCNFNKKLKIPECDLKVLGPKVTREVCERYNVDSLNSFTHIKNGEAYVNESTENYPIFLFDYCDFQKLYQPLNQEKQYRFRHVGNKPKDIVYGLQQLNTAFEKYQNSQLKDSGDEEKGSKLEKLEEAIICSGERDALNIAAMGYYPVWLNSETAELSEKNYKAITRCVKNVYVLPDIDKTGIQASQKLGMKFLEIRHILLPAKLRRFKDARGNNRKDFLDYIELFPDPKDFRKLMKVAKPMQFWNEEVSRKGVRYFSNSANTRFFLQSNGFYQLEDKNSKTGSMFVQVDGHIVREVLLKDIKAFLIQFCEDNYLNNGVLEMLLNTNRLSESTLQGLNQLDVDFSDNDPGFQLLFFKNHVWQITSKEIIESKPENTESYVWDREVVPHKVKKLDDFFNIKLNRATKEYDIEIRNHNSNYFKFLINASRVNWRKELETELPRLAEDERAAYQSKNRFSIDGELLTPEEISEQKQHLINKIFGIGYLLHRYKTQSRPWAVFAMDHIIGEEGESNGRSGKSFAFKALRIFMETITLSGRNPKLTDNPHLFDRVTEHTDYLLVDDADQYLNFKYFFDSITGELNVNPKNNKSYEIPFEKSPKFCFTSNHALRNLDTSLAARILYVVFSDYYHEKTENNNYLEARKIRDDFGKDLFGSDYTETEWNNDLNFFAQCIRFYLSVPSPQKINPPMQNVIKRNLIAEMTQHFKDWADSYFDPEGDNVNSLIPKHEAFSEFQQNSNTKRWTVHRFTRSLKAYCQFHGYTFNPKSYQNGQGRISRKVGGKAQDMIYVQYEKPQYPVVDLGTGIGEKTVLNVPF